ncbi:hypothetical protein COU01_01320 [Candidatus Falkowbacteria bacterium CG10_big_fil_rev_8_21_14_0_10_44_15]|uniref:DUF5667 domain-containing protein n=1 Tax=Candidatus Falkowbacteria bacterium CG10_big_fil_rev_8_21_14_0_10_44_15 TaxID=1974569 RepID=A0A2H0V045_9BACT|nr:MAG: hypothetical protein COU01_01320 [Candidatus Falkowbacteria bacterium CG10_big_fil_rev_8_21_14_0_10_44_15]
MEKDIITQLQSLRTIKPKESWRLAQKEILLRQISSAAQETGAGRYFWFYLKEVIQHEAALIGQPIVGVAVLILLMVGGGVFSISAASGATPGSFLYTVKLVSEKTRFALTVNSEDKARLNVKFAERRAEEIKGLADKDAHVILNEVADNLKEEISSAQEQLKQVEVNNPGTAVDLAKDIENKTTVLRQKLQETKEALAKSGSSANSKINEAIRSVDEAGLSALGTIVKSAGKNNTVNKKELSQRVASKLNITKQKITEVQADVNKVFSAGFSRSESGLQIYQAPNNVTDMETKKKAEAKTKEASKIITEAEQLLDDNNYQEAVNKITASEQILNEAAQAVDQKIIEQSDETASSTTPQVKGIIDRLGDGEESAENASTTIGN